MKLIHNWPSILIRAWSARLIILSMILSGLEAGLWIAGGALPIPPGLLFALSFIVSGAALGARIVAQPKLQDPPK